jgi:hypothetical protein
LHANKTSHAGLAIPVFPQNQLSVWSWHRLYHGRTGVIFSKLSEILLHRTFPGIFADNIFVSFANSNNENTNFFIHHFIDQAISA